MHQQQRAGGEQDQDRGGGRSRPRAFAAFQRGYFDNGSKGGCAKAGTIAVTVVAGPLNYVGVNPKIDNCKVPQPSK